MERLSEYTSLVTLITVVVGWIVVNWQNNWREERKEVRASLNEIIDEIRNIEDSATRYHSGDQRDREAENAISQNLTRLSSRVRHLRFESDEIKNVYIDFKKSITLDNFESSRFTKQHADSDILDSINLFSEQLQDHLETEFSALFRTNFSDKMASSIKRFRALARPS